MQLFGKFSRRQQEKLDDLEAQVEHTICLCALAGFSTDKIFSCISAMPEFSRVNKPRYRPKKLLETFSEICNNQSPAILSLLEEDGITAADLQKEADHLYGKHVNHGKPIRDISVKYEELGRFVERWGQAIRMLQDHKSYRLAARFEDEIRRAAINAQVPYFSSGASKKADKNLEIFNAGAEARRAEIVADAPYNNNRPVPRERHRLPKAGDGVGLKKAVTVQNGGDDSISKADLGSKEGGHDKGSKAERLNPSEALRPKG